MGRLQWGARARENQKDVLPRDLRWVDLDRERRAKHVEHTLLNKMVPARALRVAGLSGVLCAGWGEASLSAGAFSFGAGATCLGGLCFTKFSDSVAGKGLLGGRLCLMGSGLTIGATF